jgi:hypothetical protein
MKNPITSVSRRVVLIGISLVLITAAWDRPARAVDSKDVNVVNIPTVDARQSGAWNVGIDLARTPFQESLNFLIPDGEAFGLDEFTVPAGYRLVIEQVTVFTGLFPGQTINAYKVTTTVEGVHAEHYMPATFMSGGTFIGCQQVRLYADPGTTVRFVAHRTGSAGAVVSGGSISGYLIPTP